MMAYPRGGVRPGVPAVTGTLGADINAIGTSAVTMVAVVAPRPGWYLALGVAHMQRASGSQVHYNVFLDGPIVGSRMQAAAEWQQYGGTTNSQWNLISVHEVIYVGPEDLTVRLRGYSSVAASANILGPGRTRLSLIPVVRRSPAMAGPPRGGAYRGLLISTAVLPSNISFGGTTTFMDLTVPGPGTYLVYATLNWQRNDANASHHNWWVSDSALNVLSSQDIQINAQTNGWYVVRTSQWVVDVPGGLLRLRGGNDSSRGAILLANVTRLTAIPMRAMV